MKTWPIILLSFVFLCCFKSPVLAVADKAQDIQFDFFGKNIKLSASASFNIPFSGELSSASVRQFAEQLCQSRYQSVTEALLRYKKELQLEDWLYYQLIRKTAQQVSPKADNYFRYTLYKWFLMVKSGYEATLKTGKNKLLFYIQSDENIYNIPAYQQNGKQYICLNYHDYGSQIDFNTESFVLVDLPAPAITKSFSYKISRLPEFNPADYQEKQIQFKYNQNEYNFTIKLNPQIKTLFNNYPVVDYASYFNIPLSNETHRSLIPVLRKNVKGLSVKNGVNYLMHFTRYAFIFKPDTEVFGAEKRLTPEQTLLFEESDCEDRAALFFCLVKEIYNLPMIVLAYPDHVTIAVKLDKPVGKPIIYNGEKYSICEPTPQKTDLKIGEIIPHLSKEEFEIAYVYQPGGK